MIDSDHDEIEPRTDFAGIVEQVKASLQDLPQFSPEARERAIALMQEELDRYRVDES